ncbi:MAG: hypothetical protein R3E83_08235 [Burkholderiaceae bacterium]
MGELKTMLFEPLIDSEVPTTGTLIVLTISPEVALTTTVRTDLSVIDRVASARPAVSVTLLVTASVAPGSVVEKDTPCPAIATLAFLTTAVIVALVRPSESSELSEDKTVRAAALVVAVLPPPPAPAPDPPQAPSSRAEREQTHPGKRAAENSISSGRHSWRNSF